MESKIIPEKLKKGDKIVILAPSSGLPSIFPNVIENAKKFLEGMGYKVELYPTLSFNTDDKAGTPDQRVKDLHKAFSDKDVKAIICAIGGLSSNEIINKLDHNLIKNNPKIFVGYSDITLLHFAMNKFSNLITFYGPSAMVQFGELPKPMDYTVKWFKKALEEGELGSIEGSDHWTQDICDWENKKDVSDVRIRSQEDKLDYLWLNDSVSEGELTGGCLNSIAQSRGMNFEPDYSGKILLIEVSEGQEFDKPVPLSYVDSQLTDLENAGIFNKIKGLIVGRSYRYSKEDGKKFLETVKDHTKKYDFPVVCNVDVGHTDPMLTLPLGAMIKLDGKNKKISVTSEFIK